MMIKGSIIIYNEKKRKQLSIFDIERVVGDSNYSTIHLYSGRKIMISRTLKRFDELVTNFGFVRVHQKEMLDARVIKSVDDLGNVYNEKAQKISVFSRRKLQVYQLSSKGS
jgi:two-component system LytT family response regulator